MITFIHMEKNIALKTFHESAAQRRHQYKTMQRSPILLSHITFQVQNIDETYEQIIEQQHIIKFRSQNSLLFIPRLLTFLSFQTSSMRLSLISISDLTFSPFISLAHVFHLTHHT